MTASVVMHDHHHHEETKGISFLRAWTIPGMAFIAISYGFIKLIDYGLLLWLPLYFEHKVGFTSTQAKYIFQISEVGRAFGSLSLGWLSDYLKMRAPALPVSMFINGLFSLWRHVLPRNVWKWIIVLFFS